MLQYTQTWDTHDKILNSHHFRKACTIQESNYLTVFPLPLKAETMMLQD